jgi:hypothetical protein
LLLAAIILLLALSGVLGRRCLYVAVVCRFLVIEAELRNLFAFCGDLVIHCHLFLLRTRRDLSGGWLL